MTSHDDEGVADGAVTPASGLLNGKTITSPQLQASGYLQAKVTDMRLRPFRMQSPRHLDRRGTSVVNVTLPKCADTIETESYLFLMQYSCLFDTKRLALYSAYMKDATFSYQINGAVTRQVTNWVLLSDIAED